MKRLFLLIVAIVLLTVSLAQGGEKRLQTIPYNNPNISYYGRWIDSGAGKFSGWESSWIRFKFTGTTLNITVNMVGSDNATIYYCIDGTDEVYQQVTGTGDHTFSINGLSSGQHTIILKRTVLASVDRVQMLEGNDRVTFKSVQINDGELISPWPQTGSVKIEFLGDSWSALNMNVCRFMDSSRFQINPVGIGGFKASDMNTWYPWIEQPNYPQNDPQYDGVVIEYGVNDYNAGITTTDYETSILALVDKVRTQEPNAKIFLIQVPRNVAAGKNYDQYGTVLQDVVSKRTNTYYISSQSLWNSLTWQSDNAHLDSTSRATYGNWLSNQLATYYSPQLTAQTTCDIVSTPQFTADTVVTIVDSTNSIPLSINIASTSDITISMQITQFIPLSVNITSASQIEATMGIVNYPIPMKLPTTTITNKSNIIATLSVTQIQANPIPLSINITNQSNVFGSLEMVGATLIPLSINISSQSNINANMVLSIPLSVGITNKSNIIVYLRDGSIATSKGTVYTFKILSARYSFEVVN